MAYEIQTGIAELEEKLKAERAIAERFPDATLETLANGDQVWASEIATEHTTDIHIASVKNDPGVSRLQNILVYTYLTIDGMRVYAKPSFREQWCVMWLKDLKESQPDVYKAMVDAARR